MRGMRQGGYRIRATHLQGPIMTQLPRKTPVFGDVTAKASIGGKRGNLIRHPLLNRTSGRPFRSSQTAQTAKVPAPPGRSHIAPTKTAATDDNMNTAELDNSKH